MPNFERRSLTERPLSAGRPYSTETVVPCKVSFDAPRAPPCANVDTAKYVAATVTLKASGNSRFMGFSSAEFTIVRSQCDRALTAQVEHSINAQTRNNREDSDRGRPEDLTGSGKILGVCHSERREESKLLIAEQSEMLRSAQHDSCSAPSF